MIAIDFFCGGGGMTRGLIDAGIDVLAGIDNNPKCQDTYEKNNKNEYFLCDICELKPEDLLKHFPQIENSDELLLVGCAPCQPFSILTRELFDETGATIPHKSLNLLTEFSRFVKELNPAHVLVENVPGLKGKGAEVLESFKAMLESKGYHIDDKVL